MIWVVALLLMALLGIVFYYGESLMASAEEVLAKIKAFRDEVVPALTEQGEVLDKGVADIQKLHDLLDPNTGGGTQLDEAIALVDEVLAAFTAQKEKFAAIKEKIDLPEPGDTPPVEPPV